MRTAFQNVARVPRVLFESLFLFGIVSEPNGIGHYMQVPSMLIGKRCTRCIHTVTEPFMPTTEPTQALRSEQPDTLIVTDISTRKPPQRAPSHSQLTADPLLTVEDVARRLNVSKDWVWDHSSRKTPRLPVIRMGDGTLRYRASAIEDFISERERLSSLRSGRR